jgi:hypothetical protein
VFITLKVTVYVVNTDTVYELSANFDGSREVDVNDCPELEAIKDHEYDKYDVVNDPSQFAVKAEELKVKASDLSTYCV